MTAPRARRPEGPRPDAAAPGGFCSLLLADFGADVIKVEDTGPGDYVRWAPPHYEGAEPSAGSALFLSLNRGKRSIRIDLKSAAGKDVLLRLVREADVLLESFRPGVMDRLGVGYERLRQENPGLVYCAITGYGQDGPNRDRSGHDMNYLGLNGILGLTGEVDGPPDLGLGADRGSGRGRDDGRRRDPDRAPGARALGGGPAGRLLDVRRLAVVPGDARRRDARRRPRPAPRRAPARRRARVLPAVPVRRRLRHARRARAQVLGRVLPGRGARGSARPRVRSPGSDAHRAVCEIFAGRTAGQWRAFASEHDCCLEPVLGLDEALDGDLVAAREMVVELDQPGAERPVRLLGVPVKLSRTPADPVRARAPASASTPATCSPRPATRPRRSMRCTSPARSRGRRPTRSGLVHGVSAMAGTGSPSAVLVVYTDQAD